MYLKIGLPKSGSPISISVFSLFGRNFQPSYPQSLINKGFYLSNGFIVGISGL